MEKEYNVVIFNENTNEMFLYAGLSWSDWEELKNILEFLGVPYIIGETLENTKRGFLDEKK